MAQSRSAISAIALCVFLQIQSYAVAKANVVSDGSFQIATRPPYTCKHEENL